MGNNRHQSAKAEARKWVCVLSASDVSEKQKAEFELWLKQAPGNAAAFARVEQIWRDTSLISSFGKDIEFLEYCKFLFARLIKWQSGILQSIFDTPLKGSVVTACLLAFIFFSGLVLLSPEQDVRGYSTEYAEHRTVSLPDGTNVYLGGRTQLQVGYSPDYRKVSLLDGEAFFEVSSDANRPFIVNVGGTEVLVTGTSFDVHKAGGVVRVGVLEGKVEVAHFHPSSGQKELRYLSENERVVASRGLPISTVMKVKGAKPGAWRSGRLSYTERPLYSLVADMNRYYAPGVELADQSLNELAITTSFRIQQIDQVMKALQASHPLTVQKLSDGRFIITAENSQYDL